MNLPSRSLLLPCLALALCASCGVRTRDVVHVTQDITAPTTWSADKLYVLDQSLTVTAALTIPADVIVKLADGVSMTVGPQGSILAGPATGATPCVFTSIHDDASGGDSNGNGAATAPAPGDWGSVIVGASGTTFDGCRFAYGGAHRPYAGTLVVTEEASVTVTRCTFDHNAGGTLDDLRAAALDASGAGAGTALTSNVFFSNDLPLAVNGLYSLDDSNQFHGTDRGVTVKNGLNGVFWAGTHTGVGTVRWAAAEVPYVITGNPLTIPVGSTLALGPHVTLKFDQGQRIDVAGTLRASGATGTLFTSLRDDAAGGDTNGDGAATAPAPGDWGWVDLAASGSTLDQCEFRYAGSGKPYHGTVEVSNDHTATVTRCVFHDNAGGTPEDNRAAALNLGSAAEGTVVTGNTFYRNDLPLVINGLFDVDGSNTFHASNGPLHGNTYNAIFMDGVSHSVRGAVRWSNTEVAYAFQTVVLTIERGGALTLADDVVLKFLEGRLDVSGAINQANGNLFTSLRDDAALGDSNGDGAASSPADGDWTGVDLCLGGPCNWADWANIRYAANP